MNDRLTSPSSGPVALVTGASRGLGRVIAEHLSDRGYSMILTARGAEDLAQTVEELARRTSKVVGLPGDVTDPTHRDRLADAVHHQGRLDVLVNNASELGPSPLRPLRELSLEDFRRILEVNLLAPVALVQAMAPELVRVCGRIVNISSDAAVQGYPHWGGYGASKAALDLVSRTLASELGPEGVAVVSVDPGDLRTTMHQAAFPGEDISDRPPPAVTLPFWAWLFSQPNERIQGRRYRAQEATWEVNL